MALEHSIEQRNSYTVVRVTGEPTLDQFLAFVREMAAASTSWRSPLVLFDLLGVRTLTTFTEHFAVGQEVGRQFTHMKRLASVVPAARISRASEKTARQAGVNLAVFAEEGEAMAWLLAPGD